MSRINLDEYEETESFGARGQLTAHRRTGNSGKKNVQGNPRHDTDEDEAKLANEDCFAFFAIDGIIAGKERLLKPGKEASVYTCPGLPPKYPGVIAIKVYKNIDERSFKALSQYLQGRLAESGINRRDCLHILSSSESVRNFWVESEYAMLSRLRTAGLPVPAVYGRCASAIAMECVGGENPAPRLRDAEIPPAALRSLTDDVLHSVARLLELDVVHGDLSPYNVLVDAGKPVIIDFPQAIDARYNREARRFLERDIRNMLVWRNRATEQAGFRGTTTDPDDAANREAREIADILWRGYERRSCLPRT